MMMTSLYKSNNAFIMIYAKLYGPLEKVSWAMAHRLKTTGRPMEFKGICVTLQI